MSSQLARLRYAIPAVLLAVLAAFFVRGLGLNPAFIETPLLCQPAPEFSLPDLVDDSRQVASQDFAGRLVLLNVWATWCEECRHEHAYLLELARSGIPIYGLNWKDDRAEALDWLEQLGNPYVASAFDKVGDVAIDYGVYGAPETFLIGPDRTILAKKTGPLTPEVWSALFVPAIEAQQCEDD
jgi:cytochrome c biogenesis protein CcmG/thiol:disulfide interchange protein DsbE